MILQQWTYSPNKLVCYVICVTITKEILDVRQNK
jgi:hypothetical protein